MYLDPIRILDFQKKYAFPGKFGNFLQKKRN